MGESRDQIASKFVISSGAVSNIVNVWRNNIGSFVADDLRELSLSLKKSKISPLECATGIRIEKMMQKFGINEEQFEYFMSEIYNKCQILEIPPKQIGEYLAETVNMSEIVFPSQIPNYIKTKKEEIKQLQNQIEKRKDTVSNLNKEISSLEEGINSLIKENNISIDAINWYKQVKDEITEMGISFSEIPVFVDCLRAIKNQNYNVNEIVAASLQLIYYNKLLDEHDEIRKKRLYEIEQLKNTKSELEKQIEIIHLKLSKSQELKNIGMGFKELKTIYNTITEISKENEANPKEMMDAFFDDLIEYDDIIHFKKKREDLRKEVSSLNMQIANNRKIFTAQQGIGSILQELLKIGISEKDIADINSILLLGGFDYYNDNNKNIIIDKQSLVSELTKYRNIKLVVKSLEQKQIQITNNIKELENQKIILENYINYLFILWYNVRNIQMLINKINIALDYPKSILLFLFYFSFSNEDKNDNDHPK